MFIKKIELVQDLEEAGFVIDKVLGINLPVN